MKITDLGDGKVRLQPDARKILYCELDKQEHSEAVTAQPEKFEERRKR